MFSEKLPRPYNKETEKFPLSSETSCLLKFITKKSPNEKLQEFTIGPWLHQQLRFPLHVTISVFVWNTIAPKS